jgi:hypothetical protein
MADRRSRKRRKARQAARAEAAVPAEAAEALEGGYSRSRRRDEEARAALEPLAPGERPGAVTLAVAVTAVLIVANLVALIASYDPDEGGKTASTLLGALILTVVGVGMWRVRYWAVLGMQALLAVTIVLGALALLTAVNLAAAGLALAIVGFAGTLFWLLVKAMARIQMPPRPGA